MSKKIVLIVILFIGFFINSGCSIHRFDNSQVANIIVGSGQSPVISWKPPTAYQIGIYKGTKAGNGSIGEIWNKGRHGGYTNKLNSPVTVDIVLEKGQTYTVAVERKDPKGSGSGFSNTHRRYVGTKTFTVK